MANLFWVGGSGDYDSVTNHFATTSGGTASVAAVTNADVVTFDTSSGTGTVTFSVNMSCLNVVSSSANITLAPGSSTITCALAGNAWNLTAGTYTPGTSSIILTGANATFTGGGKTYGILSLNGSGAPTINGTNSFTKLTRNGTAVKTDSLILGANQTISGAFEPLGNSTTNRILVQSSTLNTPRTITAGSINAANVDFQDITNGGTTWDLSAISGGSGNSGGNTGITFTPGTTQNVTMSVSKNASDVTIYTSRVPLPQDDVTMTGVTGGTLTADMPRIGKSINWTGATGSPVWNFGSTPNTIYGSVTLIAGMTISGSQKTVFATRTASTITSAGRTFTQQFGLYAPGGSYTLQDNFNSAGTFDFNTGGWFLNDFECTVLVVTSNVTSTRNLSSGTNGVSGVGGFKLTQTTASTVWQINGSGLTMTFANGYVTISTVSSLTRTFSGGGLTYGTLDYTVAGSTGQLSLVSNNTFNTFKYSDASNARTLGLTAGSTTTVGTWLTSGGSGRLISIISLTAGTRATITKGGGTASSDYLSLKDIAAAGGASWYAGANSTDAGNNTGWNFTAVPTASGDAKVWNGTSWVAKPAKIWNGTSWVAKPIKRYNGTSFVPTTY